jgi:PadR family transcriptional regulator, regulatory protein AphA
MPRTQTPLSLEFILLGFLNESPIHGYDLYKKLRNFEGISLVWNIKQSQLYALLDKLADVGLLTSKIVPGEIHLMRKEYQITPIGKTTFLKWVTSPVTHGRDMRQEFLAKLYFAQLSGAVTYNELIVEQTILCNEWLASLQESFSKTSDDQHYERIIFQYRMSQVKGMIEWLDYCRTEIQNSFSKK